MRGCPRHEYVDRRPAVTDILYSRLQQHVIIIRRTSFPQTSDLGTTAISKVQVFLALGIMHQSWKPTFHKRWNELQCETGPIRLESMQHNRKGCRNGVCRRG